MASHTSRGAASSEEGELLYQLNHVFLPPRVPGEDDLDRCMEQALTGRVIGALVSFGEAHHPSPEPVRASVSMLRQMLDLEELGNEPFLRLLTAQITGLSDKECLLLHIRAQNAGLLVTRLSSKLKFEPFELLAANEPAASCPSGRLTRHFPGPAVAVDRSTVLDPAFLSELARALDSLNREASMASQPTIKKAKRRIAEERETTSPILVTNMLLSVLRGVGEDASAVRVCKHSREQVSWDDARTPWHRSAHWLLLRVGLRLVFDRAAVANSARRSPASSLYKPFMAYFMATILHRAVDRAIANDQMCVMSAKVSRRLQKLDPTGGEPWLGQVTATLGRAGRLMGKRWKAIQDDQKAESRLDFRPLPSLQFAPDAALAIPRLGTFLHWVGTRTAPALAAVGPGDRTNLRRALGGWLPAKSQYGLTNLADFRLIDLESWVAQHLAGWLERRSGVGSVVEVTQDLQALAGILRSYCAQAPGPYADNAESLSVMYLTIMELWAALDRRACAAVPLLAEYGHGFPEDLLHKLLLPRREQMVRLQQLEQYLWPRSMGRKQLPCEHFGRPDSFAVRYFDQSASLQQLRSTIDARARVMYANKVAELQRLKAQYARLTQMVEATAHQQTYDRYQGKTVCNPHCPVCGWTREKEAMTINVFEWPLPTGEAEEKAAVFETSVPEPVAIWRETTLELLTKVFGAGTPTPKADKETLWYLSNFGGLQAYKTRTTRACPASPDKPFVAAHYATHHVGTATVDAVCVPHGGHYKYVDSRSGQPIDDATADPHLPASCSLSVAIDAPLLRGWAAGTEHTSNEVVAAQSACPPSMRLDAFRAFGHLRSGVRIQWINILHQLLTPALPWNTMDACVLITQAVEEAGPDDASSPATPFRQAHDVTQIEDFVVAMADGIRMALARIEESWEHGMTLVSLVVLCMRLHSLAPSVETRSALCGLAARLRRVAYGWSQALLARLARSEQSQDVAEWTGRSFLLLLTCIATFDLEAEQDLLAVLQAEDEAAMLLEASLQAHELAPTTGLPTDKLELFLFQRRQRTAYRAQKILRRQVEHVGSGCLDLAVRRVWCDCPEQNAWRAGGGEQEHVLGTTVSLAGRPPMPVTFNLLTGQLLVNGSPLTKLPSEYRTKKDYVNLFGRQSLDVVPSTDPGMQFAVTSAHEGYNIKLGIIQDRLVVRAARDGQTLEYVPCRYLSEDLPVSFVEDYAHWLDVDTGEIEFRPADTPWKSAPDNWRLRRHHDNQYFLVHGHRHLIEPRSATGTALATLLAPMEEAEHIHVTYEPDLQRLEIQLPRVGMAFYLTQGQATVASKQYEGMCVDEDQSFGSLVGLRSKLVLRPQDNPHGMTSCRRLLVPEGNVAFEATAQHVAVTVDNTAAGFYHDYIIDEKLGRLAGGGTLRSQLLLSYLHALTAHCLPDPLTGRTGTEESLRILQSGAVRSFARLDEDCAALLTRLADVSPTRKYYPEHLTSMEQVRWSEHLPSLSQHEGFVWAVQAIASHAKDCELFSEGPTPTHITSMVHPDVTDDLNERAMVRNAVFRVSGYGAQDDAMGKDQPYEGRTGMDEKTSHAYQATKSLVNEWAMLPKADADETADELEKLLGENIVGPASATNETLVQPQFDMQWLQSPKVVYPQYWCRLLESLGQVDVSSNKYRLIFFFASMAFAEDAHWSSIMLLLGRTLVPSMRAMQVPDEPVFVRSYREKPRRQKILAAVGKGQRPFQSCPEGQFGAIGQYSLWQRTIQRHVEVWADRIMAMWPQKNVTTLPPYPEGEGYFTESRVNLEAIAAEFLEATRNSALNWFMFTLIEHWSDVPAHPNLVPEYYLPDEESLRTSNEASRYVSSYRLFQRRCPELFQPEAPDFSAWYENDDASSAQASRLPQLLDGLQALVRHQHGREYIGELQQSFAAFQASGGQVALQCCRLSGSEDERREAFARHLDECRQTVADMEQSIQEALEPSTVAEQAAQSVAAWPRVSRIFLLERLSRHHWPRLPKAWKKSLTAFAVALTYLQQAERLLDARSQATDLVRELTSAVHTWDVLQQPESLLLEVEQGLLIRQVQDEVAAQMRSPPDDNFGSVLQLNMGEGKSSVIMPAVAASLANGDRLVRIIVGKAQSQQMAHLLVSRLGGLLDRRVFFLPFSRSLHLDSDGAEKIRRMLRTCEAKGGVLLVQPEHLLSFQLMALEYCQGDRRETGEAMLQMHDDWSRVARDMVDESDDNFGVRFELIYTMGSQQPIDFHVGRWTLIQQVLARTASLARQNRAAYGAGLQLDDGPDGPDSPDAYPHVRILEAAAGRSLVCAVARDICTRGLRGFPILQQPQRVRDAVLRYICDLHVSEADIPVIEGFSGGTACKPLLLLRGLFARGILAFALGQKRYRVHYGLAPARQPPTRLAVPFRAKDAPAPRSEFSHPDVVIVLTCLSYYYRGLDNDELTVCFERLNQLDRAKQEYDSWVRQSPLLSASSFRDYASVNIRDHRQCVDHIFPALRRVKAVVDFYLAHVVFPVEMREFPKKLSASGWDLARRKKQPLTGFSGTNDAKYVLPLSVKSRDMAAQQHTNAAVLDCLLGAENCVVELGHGDSDNGADVSETLAADVLLGHVTTSTPPIQVILDVGAQIIELDNQQMARQWLLQTSPDKADAVIFFDDSDNLLVLTRTGVPQRFLTSPFASRTDRCLVFLDQAHTRGTDLRLPDHYRAAVTLGPKITKDTLVQACMRMRKLGRGQSVVFCVSPEMQNAIRSLRDLAADQPLVVADVLAWAITETWDETLRSLPLWATQGLRHHHQSLIWDRVATDDGPMFRRSDIEDYLEDEAQTLETRYRPGSGQVSVADMLRNEDDQSSDLRAIQRKCVSFGITSLGSATLQEEQERELANEIEEERQVDRPPPTTAVQHRLAQVVERFVAMGATSGRRPTGFFPAFASLQGTAAVVSFPTAHAQFSLSPTLLTTADFANTVTQSLLRGADAYQRPVQWILAGHPDGVHSNSPPRQLVILSPWEVNMLLPRIRASDRVSLHLYGPRMSLSLPSLEGLRAFVVPPIAADWAITPLLMTQLNLFSGQMYLSSYADYSRLCGYLGLSMHENTGDEALPGDGFVGRQSWNRECPFTVSPVGFLNELFKRIRGDCLEITETHMGRVLSGEILSEEDFV